MKKKKARLGNIGWNPSPNDMAGIDIAAKLIFLFIMAIAFIYPLFST
jgi:hypothetical protein